MTKQKVIGGIAMLILGALVMAGCGQPPEAAKIAVGYRTHDLYAPLFVGLEQKIFAKHGLAVEAVPFDSSNQLMDAIIGGKVQASLGGINIPLVLTVEDKSPGTLKLFSQVNDSPAAPLTYLLVRKDSTIISVADLKGKKVGAFLGSTAAYLYTKTAVPFFKPDEATLVQMSPDLELAALQSGQVDAIIVLEPLATIGVQKNIARVLVASLFDTFVMKDMPNASSVVTAKFARDNPTAARALREATAEAIAYINSHPEETKQAIAKYVPGEAEYLANIKLPHFIPEGEMNRAAIQREADLLLADKQLKNSVKIDSLFDW